MRTILCLISLLVVSFGQRPNVCKTFMDYFTMNSKNCWYDPLIDADAKELIKANGYPFEEYEVETPDGYLLTVFRIPRKNPKGVIFLQHPATTSCTGWIDKGNDSFAFLLWNANYDVWMGNFRGNYYSRKHKFLNPDEQKFWDFSFHELGVYDIPTQLELTVNVTNVKPQGISFVGFSMGSTAALIYSIEKADHSTKWLNIMVLMAPAAFLKNTHPVVQGLSKSSQSLMNFAVNVNLVEVIPRNQFIRDIQEVCRRPPIMFMCMIIDLAVFGNVPEELGAKYYPIRYSQVPAGMATKAYIHYLQLVESGDFRKFDYGPEKNLKIYNSSVAPKYDIQKIKCPIYFMYSDHDPIVAPKKYYPIRYSQVPAGMATKAYIHYLQLAESGDFRKFDYGPEKNLKIYNSSVAPKYDIQKIKCPIYFMYSDHDPIVAPKDVEYMYDLLPDRAKIYGKRLIRNFAHQNFFYGTHIVDWIYLPLIRMFDDIFEKMQ